VGLTSERSVPRVIVALFFVSGACGLVYEVVWMRMLTLIFGATAFATAAILASFFAGLALGSLAFGKVADRTRHPLALYAALEAGIGVFAFVMPALLAAVTWIYVAVARHVALGFYPLSLLRLALSVPVLLLPATLMGGTLPVIVKFVVRGQDRLGLNVARLYAVNTFGAVLGAFAAGFFLILLLGVRESAYLAGAVNLALAGVAYWLSRRVEARTATPPGDQHAAAASAASDAATPNVSPGLARLALWAVALSGLAALALEVLWTRALVYFLDNSTHAFTTMLTAFLLGIALGSALLARFADRRIPLVALFGVVELLIALSALVAIPILGRSTPVLTGLESQPLNALFLWKWIGLRFVRSLSVMLVPTILMGMTVPLAAKIYTRRLDRLGASLGHVYSANTIGGVLGSLIAGFVLVPVLGVRNGIVAAAALSAGTGAVLLLAEPALRGRALARAGIAGGALLVFAGAAWLPTHSLVLASYRERADAAGVLSYREGIGSTVKVFQDRHGERLLSIDGFPVAGTTRGMLDAQESLGNVPLLLSSVPRPRVNLIGFGAGGASWESLQYDVAGVDCVELVPAVIDAAGWFPDVNHDVLHASGYHLIMGDGRNYAMVANQQYDVISVDATTPKMAGDGSLYTLEFYRLLARRLTEDGLAVQWLPFHLLSDAEVRMTTRTFMEAFPHTTLWLSPLRYHGLLVGSRRKLQIDVQALRRKFQRPGVRQELARVGVEQPLDFLAEFVMGEDELRAYAAGARVNTDDHPYLEFTPAWSYFVALRFALENLDNFRKARTSIFPLLVNTGDTPAAVAALADSVTKRYDATQHGLKGEILFYLGRREQAEQEWAAARSLDSAAAAQEQAIWRTAGAPP
jgi:spermidine synthase